MSSALDENTAWDLVRAVVPGTIATDNPARIYCDGSTEIWLEVEASGRWQASSEPTDAAHDLFELYLPLQLRTRLVIAQMAQSLDGRIATEAGHSQFMTGPADIRRLHRLRALMDAVIVGASTVAFDNPRLTVRKVAGDDPVRVVLDPENRLDPGSIVFTDGAARTLVIRRAPSNDGRAKISDDVLELPVVDPFGFDPDLVLAALRQEGLQRVLVEGGGITVSRFLQAGVLDRLHVTVAPALLGSGCLGLTLDPIQTLDQALRPPSRRFILGDDVLFDLDLNSKRPVSG